MANFRFLHCADLHLDSPLRGLEADPDAPADVIRGATRAAFRNLIDHAISERVDFVVAAGDLYDGDWQDWRTGHFLIGQLALLQKAGIPFIAIRGNHDAESQITRRLRMPGDNTRWLSATRPETFRLTGLPVSIHGQSFANRAIPENLAKSYPPADPGRFNIGLLHSSVTGSTVHATYAPCDVEQLREHGYQYWALGHVHERAELSRDPWIVFPGNLQGRHANETGPKGATLVTVDGLQVTAVTPLVFDSVRWARVDVELRDTDEEDAALGRVRQALEHAVDQAEGRLLAARVILSGACLAHDAFVRDPAGLRAKIHNEALAAAGPGAIWIEAVRVSTRLPPAAGSAVDRTDAIGMMARALDTLDAAIVQEGARAYAATMLERSGLMRQAIGDKHVAASVAAGDIPEELWHHARDLLLTELAKE